MSSLDAVRVPSAWKLGDRLSRSDHSAARQLRKALRCLSFDLYIFTGLLREELISGMSDGK